MGKWRWRNVRKISHSHASHDFQLHIPFPSLLLATLPTLKT